MTAVETRLLRSGMSATVTASYDVHLSERGPDIYGTVRRHGLFSVEWEITAGPTGEPLAWGHRWTESGAWLSATAAAHRPGIGKEAAR